MTMECPNCVKKNPTRIIKVGKTQQRTPKQKYYCYGCGGIFSRDIEEEVA